VLRSHSLVACRETLLGCTPTILVHVKSVVASGSSIPAIGSSSGIHLFVRPLGRISRTAVSNEAGAAIELRRKRASPVPLQQSGMLLLVARSFIGSIMVFEGTAPSSFPKQQQQSQYDNTRRRPPRHSASLTLSKSDEATMVCSSFTMHPNMASLAELFRLQIHRRCTTVSLVQAIPSTKFNST